MVWQVRSSNKMLILGLIFIIAGFALMTAFFKFVPFSSSDRLTGWLWAVLIMLVFGLGFFSIIVVKIRDALATLLALFLWSLILLVPVPLGYEEVYYGGSVAFLGIMLVLYVKYKEYKKKKCAA